MGDEVVQWICEKLTEILQIGTTEDVAQCILSMKDPMEMQSYMYEMLDKTNPQHRRFVQELVRRVQPVSAQMSSGAPPAMVVYKKNNFEEDGKVGKKANNKHKTETNKNMNTAPVETESKEEKKKKQKFVNLFSQEGHSRSVIKLPGRHVCDCEASKHGLVSNCTDCGRIVCKQEGSGPCTFCGSLVVTKEEKEILNRGSKKSEQLLAKLMGESKDREARQQYKHNSGETLDKAIKHKEKLLEYDKTCEKRTHVIDDESDYFSVDNTKWMSPAQRESVEKRQEQLRAQKYASRRDRKITFDFAGRQVVEESDNIDLYNPDDEILNEIKSQENAAKEIKMKENKNSIVNPNIKFAAPKLRNIGEDRAMCKNNKWEGITEGQSNTPLNLRIQDREMQLMCDAGVCLSMHQPYASLLIRGIKKHEGRTWYTSHRGRLWIASGSKQPSDLEIKETEGFYSHTGVDCPSTYPVGCLLGCVDVSDCVGQEDYTEKYPGGDSRSPYVFICENPQELPVKFPIKGQHKIYKLDAKIHQAAQKMLKHIQ